MKQARSMTLFLAVLAFGYANGAIVKTAEKKAVSPINPPLKDVSSDKKFFGPPFPADYPQDSRPVVQKKILDQLKSPDQPYPALQAGKDFDKDYVKDENSDRGTWKAQFEYDALRRKLAGEESDVKNAEDAANKEGRDVDDAQKKADAAGKDADAAAKDADAANKDEGKKASDGTDDADEGEVLPPSQENLDKLKKQVAEAEAAYEKEQKEFEECKRQLEEAKKAVEDLKAKQAEMEQQLAGATKLWAETKATRKTLHKAKVDAAHAKTVAAQARLEVALNNKADMENILAKEKAESDRAHDNLKKEKADLEQAKKDLEKATLKLQKLRGYSPADAPLKSGSYVKSTFVVLALAAMHCLF